MKSRAGFALRILLILGVCSALLACGGGGGGGGSIVPRPVTPPAATPLTISYAEVKGLIGHPYSMSMSAQGGNPPYTWTVQYLPPGLSFDVAKLTISGTPTTSGTYGVSVEVSDSGSPTQTIGARINIGIADPLHFTSWSFTFFHTQYDTWPDSIRAYGGIWPYTYSLSGGSLPPGLRFRGDSDMAYLEGAPLETGTYTFSVTVSDAFTPPEVVTQQYTMKVTPAGLTLNPSFPTRIALNRSFSGRMIAAGGLPPYTFSVASSPLSTLPPGLSPVDAVTGLISGTPTTAGRYSCNLRAQDSDSPPQFAYTWVTFEVAPPLGRNDSPATATPIKNGTISASMSPYIDPPNGPPYPADHDYYAVEVWPGDILHIETHAKRNDEYDPLDSVLEIVDANGLRLTGCRQPGDTGSNFNGSCINDDIGGDPYTQDSALDYQTPAGPAAAQSLYVHVFDWSGSARPDMTYSLAVSGSSVIQFNSGTSELPTGAEGVSYYGNFSLTGGKGTLTVIVASGELPPGISMSYTNTAISLTGKPTAAGTYSFTLQATDQGTPPQVASKSFSFVVNPQLHLADFSVPPLTVGQTFTLQAQASGGMPPYHWYIGDTGVCNGNIDANGLLTLYPTAAGTCSFYVSVQDAGPPLQTTGTTVSATVTP